MIARLLFPIDLSGVRTLSYAGWVVVLGSILHVASLSSTSFIEEEHETWYLLCATLVAARLLDVWSNARITPARRRTILRDVVLLLVCSRIARNWNRSGTAWFSKDTKGKHQFNFKHLTWP